jgi:hypothetical protein
VWLGEARGPRGGATGGAALASAPPGRAAGPFFVQISICAVLQAEQARRKSRAMGAIDCHIVVTHIANGCLSKYHEGQCNSQATSTRCVAVIHDCAIWTNKHKSRQECRARLQGKRALPSLYPAALSKVKSTIAAAPQWRGRNPPHVRPASNYRNPHLLATIRPVPMWPSRRKTSKAAAEKFTPCHHATST